MPRLALALCLLCLAFAAGCSRPSATPTDTAGPRIVALSPAVAVILRDLGLEGRVVGKHDWDIILDPAMPTAGDQRSLDYETLLRLRPTDVIIEWGDRPLPPRLVELADANGWRVTNVALRTLAELDTQVSRLHELFERPGEPPSVSRALREMRDETREPAFDGTILLLASIDPPAAVGPGSFHHDLLLELGLTPAIDAAHPLAGPWIELDAEDVRRLSPDGIIFLLPGTPTVPELGVLGRLGLPALEAGRAGVVSDPLALLPSTALGDVARRMAAIVQSWEAAAAPTTSKPAMTEPTDRDQP